MKALVYQGQGKEGLRRASDAADRQVHGRHRQDDHLRHRPSHPQRSWWSAI